MKNVIYTCDVCKNECAPCVSPYCEPVISYRECRKMDSAGDVSTYVNLIHICGDCARRFLSALLCGTKTPEIIRERFDRQTSL